VTVCVLVPTYDNPRTVRSVVERARETGLPVLVVDDGSAPEGQEACAALAREGLAEVCRRERNGGKGAAVKTGLALARARGFTHAAQVDADGQHDLSLLPSLVEASRARPEALILGCPVHDASIPRGRKIARRFTQLWIDLEVGKGVIEDAMVGFRVYPIEAALRARARGDRMDFDVEIPVRMAWQGTPIVNFPVPVRYLSEAEGGVSHFQPLRDNLRFSWLHARLSTTVCLRWLARKILRRLPRRTSA
jgi:glycosyltransferase involved in cell wall biosynthesis